MIVSSRTSIGPRGVDVGCGQGWYVGSMREQGFEVTGFDLAADQMNRARLRRYSAHDMAVLRKAA